MGQPQQDVVARIDDPDRLPASEATALADRRLLIRLALAVVAACATAVPVAFLAIVIKNSRGPVARLDLAIAEALNRFAVEHGWFVGMLDWISTIGHPATFRIGATVAALWLLSVDRPRLALWTLVTTWGGALLGVLLKVLIERARPALPDAVAAADGYSFPSGHALGAFVGCAVLMLLWLDMAQPRRRWLGWVGAAVAVAAVCFSRLGLGVHYLSDVLGGCLVGLGWTAATTIVFQVWRAEAGLRHANVVEEGIEPERAEPDADPRPLPPWWASVADVWKWLPRLVLPWVALIAATIGVGLLTTKVLDDTPVGDADRSLPIWFADHRTPVGDQISGFGSLLGETNTIVILTFSFYLTGRLVFRRWRESTAMLFAVVGEVWGFVLVTLFVDRPRPPVPHLDEAPPTSGFPSGHTAAAVCCYGMIALLVARFTGRRAWPMLAAAGAIAVGVAVARLYRGMHQLTDVLAGAAYGTIWLVAVAVVMLKRPS